MAFRIDLLGVCAERDALVGKLLVAADKSALAGFVAETACATAAPVSLVSLMGKRSQILAAQTGLPVELSTVGLTDRSVSLCQKTVRDGQRTEWTDASLDEEAPQGMVETYGVRSYLGVPLIVDEVAVGALCIADVVPRAFSPEERRTLDEMGKQVSQSLQRSLDAVEAMQHLRDAEVEAIEPVFGELRNVLSPLLCGVSQAALSNAELQGALRVLRIKDARLRERVEAVLQDTQEAGQDLDDILREVGSSTTRVTRAVLAMESLFDRARPLRSVRQCVADATTLAEHFTKIIGGVASASTLSAEVMVPARSVVSVLALILGAGSRRLIARKLGGGFRLSAVETQGRVAIRICNPLWGESDIADCIRRAAPLVKQQGSLTLAPSAGGVELLITELAQPGASEVEQLGRGQVATRHGPSPRPDNP